MPIKFDPQKHHRSSIRLKAYDYAQAAAYYVTICTWQRECLFGEVANGQLQLNRAGEIVLQAWRDLPRHYPHLELGEFCIMPNHVHGIMILGEGDPYATIRHGLSEIVRAFKSFSARRVNVMRHAPGFPVWQRNYYEHIVRDEADLRRIVNYIQTNPSRWAEDEEYPGRR